MTLDVPAYYTDLLAKHGPIPAAVDASREGLRVRHEVLRKALPDTRGRILDVGCGYGALLDHLYEYGRFGDEYVGIDLAPAMIEVAKTHRPNIHFEVRDLVEEPFDRPFDYVVASGLFQFAKDAERTESLLQAMWRTTTDMMAFNMLSRLADEQAQDEAYFEAGRLMVHFQAEFTPYVEVLHGYRKNDFTVILRRGPVTQ